MTGELVQASPLEDIAKISQAQDFWLSSLASAEAFTRWVVVEISPWLGKSVLEVGCGIGTYTSVLADDERLVVALDRDPSYVERAAARVTRFSNMKVFCADAGRLDWLNGQTFDTVLLLDVLEHVKQDTELVKLLSAQMTARGHLIVKVPAEPSLYSSLDEAIGHYRRYDFESLEGVLRSADLEVVKMWSFNALGVLGWWWNGRVLERKVPPKAHVSLFNYFLPFIYVVDKFARLLGGLSIIAIARRRTDSG